MRFGHISTLFFSYSVCIRQEAGFCCVLYTPCADANSFSLALDGAGAVAAGTDSLCSLDYIAIPGKGPQRLTKT